jgi:hypothetical protein
MKKVTYLSPTTKERVTLYESQMLPEEWDKAMQQIAGLDTAVWVDFDDTKKGGLDGNSKTISVTDRV